MKFSTRLIIIFFTILLLPLTLTLGTIFLLSNLQTEKLVHEYGYEHATELALPNTLQIVNDMTKDVYEDLFSVITKGHTLKGAKKSVENYAYWDELNHELLEVDSFLVVRKDETVIYSGSIEDISLKVNSLPEFDSFMINTRTSPYISDNFDALVKQLDFYFSDGSSGSFFVITPVTELLPQLKTLFTQIIFIAFVILLLTSIFLTIWMYRGIMAPIKKLQEATRNIRDGNLDFSLSSDTRDEIGALCQNFEAMRAQLKNTSDQKLKYDTENRELISNISHDLKTPITAIKGYCEGIIDGVADTPERVDKYIKTIYNKSMEMDLLINELTFYSKVDTNKLPYNFIKINITDFFNDCAEEIHLELESQNAMTLSYLNHIGPETLTVADPEQIKRVINNIISNSIKYQDKPKGHIEIILREDLEYINIEISDNGRGISSESLPYIFDRFYRADASRNTSKGGSGIGLSIVKKIIEDHGGRIGANSVEGEGTTIYFSLKKYKED